MYDEFLGLCPLGGEVAFNNELKRNGFVLTKKFPGRLFFKAVDNSQLYDELNSCEGESLHLQQPKKRIGIKGNFSHLETQPDTTHQNKLIANKTKMQKSKTRKYLDKEKILFLQCLKANIQLRLPDRIGLVISSFKCTNFDELFENTHDIEWEQFCFEDSKIIIEKVSISNSKIDSTRSLQSIASKAIYSRLCHKWKLQKLPETGEPISIRIYLDDNWARIVIDLSGEPLYHRGYRLAGGLAPMRETMAALLLQLLLWKRKIPLHDPFCGSGTIPIEAFLYAYNIAPGILRTFAFQRFRFFSDSQFHTLFMQYKSSCINAIQTDYLVRISGSDISHEAISLSRANLNNAVNLISKEMKKFGCNTTIKNITFFQSDISEITAEYDEGLLLGNPPYGERIGDETEAFEIYEKLALKMQQFTKWKKAFITNKPEFAEILQQHIKKLDIKSKPVKVGKLDTMLYYF